MKPRAKFDAASFILAGEIRSRINKQTNKQTQARQADLGVGVRKSERRRRDNRGGEGVVSEEGVSPSPWRGVRVGGRAPSAVNF